MGGEDGGYSLLHVACGARCDSLTRRDLAQLDEFCRQPSLRQGDEDICAFMSRQPVIDHWPGSPLVVKALLEHPSFELVNYTYNDHWNRSGATALHMLLSTSGRPAHEWIRSDYFDRRERPSIGYHSYRHLAWDAKVAAANIFLDHVEANPGKIELTLRCGGHVAEPPYLLPAELARRVGFPLDVVHRLETLTLTNVPEVVVRQVGTIILQFI
eukprot:TRINITY_DN24658_c1_g1_i3.p1 TRINITY_DN24658_c1_g1~~TRINITY_DN24658_c1_g1_i3.p1  ORF type:complete len:213 (-),score=7.34 TRINITY_DN24658_c1_g1_i3:435-1073(-)